ncbi:hypothetical protein Tco_0199020 [Tanacetum coccineum]
MEEINLFLASDDLMPSGIENDDYDSEGDIRSLEELLINDSLPLTENESSSLDHFNDPSSPRPPPEPPDAEICLNFKPDTTMKNDIFELNKDDSFDQGGGTDNQEKDEKQSQNDKTGLGMEKTVKDKAKSKPESVEALGAIRTGFLGHSLRKSGLGSETTNPKTSKEILQAQNDLMEAIQAFLKEYDHIPPNEKCMALLLAEERLLKIKQTMEEEQNQREVMQDMLLKLMDDLQILKGSQQEKKETAAQSFTPYQNFSMIDDEEARDNFLKDVCTFLRKFSCIPFGLTPKVILIAWESFGKIKDALADKQYQQEDIQELMSKLLKDVKPTEITPDLLIEEPDNSLSMGDEHLDTIPSVENLVPILTNHSEILSDPNDDGTSSDDDDFEDIKYVSLEEVNDVDQKEKEFNLEDILKIQDVILREKLLNISRLITNIKSLNDNSTPNCVLKFTSPFPIPDSNSFFEKSNTSISYSDNFYPNWSLLAIIRKRRVVANDPLLEFPEFESFHFDFYDDPSFPRPPPEPPDVEISLIIETDAPVINNFDELNEDECFDPGGGEINVEVDDSFTFVTWIFLPYLTYPEVSPLLSSTKNEDTIFDPGIST